MNKHDKKMSGMSDHDQAMAILKRFYRETLADLDQFIANEERRYDNEEVQGRRVPELLLSLLARVKTMRNEVVADLDELEVKAKA